MCLDFDGSNELIMINIITENICIRVIGEKLLDSTSTRDREV